MSDLILFILQLKFVIVYQCCCLIAG